MKPIDEKNYDEFAKEAASRLKKDDSWEWCMPEERFREIIANYKAIRPSNKIEKLALAMGYGRKRQDKTLKQPQRIPIMGNTTGNEDSALRHFERVLKKKTKTNGWAIYILASELSSTCEAISSPFELAKPTGKKSNASQEAMEHLWSKSNYAQGIRNAIPKIKAALQEEGIQEDDETLLNLFYSKKRIEFRQLFRAILPPYKWLSLKFSHVAALGVTAVTVAIVIIGVKTLVSEQSPVPQRDRGEESAAIQSDRYIPPRDRGKESATVRLDRHSESPDFSDHSKSALKSSTNLPSQTVANGEERLQKEDNIVSLAPAPNAQLPEKVSERSVGQSLMNSVVVRTNIPDGGWTVGRTADGNPMGDGPSREVKNGLCESQHVLPSAPFPGIGYKVVFDDVDGFVTPAPIYFNLETPPEGLEDLLDPSEGESIIGRYLPIGASPEVAELFIRSNPVGIKYRLRQVFGNNHREGTFSKHENKCGVTLFVPRGEYQIEFEPKEGWCSPGISVNNEESQEILKDGQTIRSLRLIPLESGYITVDAHYQSGISCDHRPE
ncbi:MAG: hypothetical protein PHU25_01210 [Deltaproteobacteria bacterium]|nr:hypothetical protein [Deltaproteobacteria bacterium]